MPLANASVILLVDDDRMTRIVTCRVLKKVGYQVLEASSGIEGLSLYGEKQPDLVLLDISMSGIDGFECCRQMRRFPNSQSIPILMVTGLKDTLSVEKAFQAGATDYITKPVRPSVLLGRIYYLLQAAQAEKQLRLSEMKYRTLVENLQEVILCLDQEGRLTFINSAWYRLMGYTEAESMGELFVNFLHPQEQKRFAAQLQKIQSATRQGFECDVPQFRSRCITKNQTPIWIDIQLWADSTQKGTFSIAGRLNDINDKTIREQYRRLGYAINRILAKHPPLTTLIRRTLQAICGNIDFHYGEFWQLNPISEHLICTETWHLQTPTMAEFARKSQDTQSSAEEGILGQVWAEQTVAWLEDCSQAPQFLRRELAEAAGFRLVLACPASHQGKKFGVMLLFSQEHVQLDEDLIRVITLITRDLSRYFFQKYAEAEFQRYNQLLQMEIERASDYVASLLPSATVFFKGNKRQVAESDDAFNPEFPGSADIEIGTQFQPSSQLGGDAFDYYWLDDEHLVFYLLDVAGHGVKSALLSISVLHILRRQALSKASFYEPETVLAELNNIFEISDNGEDYFTIWYGIYHSSSRQLKFASAGHPPAILIFPEDDQYHIQHLDTDGIAIGMLPDYPFQPQQHTIPIGSSLFVFSDGAYEIASNQEQNWGFECWSDYLLSYRKANSKCDTSVLMDKVQQVNGEKLLDDDFSVMEIRFH